MVVGAILLSVLSAAPKGPCPHPYFPLEEGLTLVYRAGKSEVPVRIHDVKATPDGLSATLEMTLKGRTGSTEARCTKDGISTGLGGIEGLALQSSGMDMSIEKTEGVVLPPPDGLKPGASWTNTLVIDMRPPKSAQQSGGIKGALASALVIKTTLRKDATVVGPDKVETPAGKWDALKVTNKTTAVGGDAGSERTVESTMWMVPKIGIVKVMTGDSVDFELVKIEHGSTASAK